MTLPQTGGKSPHRFFLILLFSLFTLLPLVSATGLLNNLTGYYGFNEGSGDYTNNSVGNPVDNGMRVNNTAQWTEGIIGSALDYSFYPASYNLGGNHPNVSVGTDIPFYNDWSISFWVYRFDSTDTGYVYLSRVAGTTTSGIALNYSRVEYHNTLGAHFRSTSAIPIPLGEWTHVVLAVNNASSYSNNSYLFYINGQPTGTETAATVTAAECSGCLTFGGAIGVSPTYIPRNETDSVVDEIAIWANRTITPSEVIDLYNGGNALPYSSFSLAAPVQTASFGDISMGASEQWNIYPNGYFTDYDELYLSFSDSIAGVTVFLDYTLGGATQTYTSDHLNVTIDNSTGVPRIRFRSATTDFSTTMTIVALNANGQTSDTFNFDITVGAPSSSYPEQISSIISPYTIGFETSRTINLNNVFTNYQAVVVNFTDALVNSSQSFVVTKGTSDTDSYTTTNMSASLIDFAGNLVLTFASNLTAFSTNFTISAYNEAAGFGDIFTTQPTTTSFVLTVRNESALDGNPPQVIASPTVITLDAGESYIWHTSDFFVNYTTFNVYFSDNEAGATVQVGGAQTYSQGYYTVYGQADGFRVLANQSSYQQVFTLRATNEYGSSSIDITVIINAGEYPSEGQPGAGYGSVVGVWDSWFPNPDTLTLRQKFAYVFMTLLIVTIILLMFGYNTEYMGLALWLACSIDVLLLIYFISIRYIPVIIPIIFGVLGVFVAYLMFKGRE